MKIRTDTDGRDREDRPRGRECVWGRLLVVCFGVDGHYAESVSQELGHVYALYRARRLRKSPVLPRFQVHSSR